MSNDRPPNVFDLFPQKPDTGGRTGDGQSDYYAGFMAANQQWIDALEKFVNTFADPSYDKAFMVHVLHRMLKSELK